MPSSKKTPYLYLNKWLGGDKPKKDDFNEDNEILDASIGDLKQRMGRSEQAQQALSEQLGEGNEAWSTQLEQAKQSWDSQLGNLKNTVEAQGDDLVGMLTVHAANRTIHLTAEERVKWNAMGPVIGTYSGNGSAQRDIALGFTPRAGFLFAHGRPLVKSDYGAAVSEIWSAMMTAGGCSSGISLLDNGFRVLDGQPNSEGIQYKLNTKDWEYLYVVWK